MMNIETFLRSVAFALGLMAILAVVETALPFSRKDWRKRHLVPNLLLTVVTLGLNFVLNAGAILATAWLHERDFGVLGRTSLSPHAATAIGVLALDGATYACHRLMHAFPVLWRFHSVHHADPLVDVTTTLRAHPAETAWRFAFVMVPAWLLGLPAEAVAVYRVVSVLMAVMEHANVKLWQPLDGALSFVIGTPNMHKLHHSQAEGEANTNYGNILSLFDRALGTFTPSARAEFVDAGLDGRDGDATQRFVGLLRLPFRRQEPTEDEREVTGHPI